MARTSRQLFPTSNLPDSKPSLSIARRRYVVVLAMLDRAIVAWPSSLRRSRPFLRQSRGKVAFHHISKTLDQFFFLQNFHGFNFNHFLSVFCYNRSEICKTLFPQNSYTSGMKLFGTFTKVTC